MTFTVGRMSKGDDVDWDGGGVWNGDGIGMVTVTRMSMMISKLAQMFLSPVILMGLVGYAVDDICKYGDCYSTDSANDHAGYGNDGNGDGNSEDSDDECYDNGNDDKEYGNDSSDEYDANEAMANGMKTNENMVF